jgi:hypothetical protein
MSDSAIRDRFSFHEVSENSNFWWNKNPTAYILYNFSQIPLQSITEELL